MNRPVTSLNWKAKIQEKRTRNLVFKELKKARRKQGAHPVRPPYVRERINIRNYEDG